MRILLTDGSGLTSRQVASQLGHASHRVEVLSPSALALTRFTRWVHRVHRTPAYGSDPLGWLVAALSVYRAARMDVLFPTQEQVAALSACADLADAQGVRTAIPPFAALRQVQDKLAACRTLSALDLPQPCSAILPRHEDVTAWDRFPVYMKLPIGTATTGVRLVSASSDLPRVVAEANVAGAFEDGGVLAQAPVAGRLAMIQTIFARGELVAFHACLRVREGSGGGASGKLSVRLPAAQEHLAALGRHLGWHGALSADAILTDAGPVYIDLNPRLVEPGNALRSGVDLVTPMLELATGGSPTRQPPARPGVATHQLLLAVLGAAEHAGTRRAVLTELASALSHAASYRRSREELTPLQADPVAALPLLVAASAVLVHPPAWRWFAASSVSNYALTASGWREILERAHAPERA